MELSSFTVLFEKPIPVETKGASGEERQVELVIRMSTGYSKHLRNAKVLRVQLTDDSDPFFFYTMEVSEDEFMSLRVEQAILVDFSTFPHKIIELLERCIKPDNNNDKVRFVAVLKLWTGDSTFSIMEINQFKHLCHLSLCFRQGNESTVKACLAGRLSELKVLNAGLQEKLQKSLESQKKSVQDIEELKREIVEVKQRQCMSLAELGAKHTMDLAVVKEKALQECIELKEKLERERADMEYRLRQRADVQEDHVNELDKLLREALSTKHGLEMKLSEQKSMVDTLQKDLEDKERVLSKKEHLEKEMQDNSKTVNQYLIRLASLEQEVQSKNELLFNMTKRLESETSLRTSLEKSLDSASERAHDRASTCSSDSNKCCQSVERLQCELRACKAKAKLKAQVVHQQDSLLHERQCSMEKSAEDMNILRQDLATLKQDNDLLRRKADESKQKLEEMEELSKSNQELIQWLNQQLTDSQLCKFGFSSRYSFKSDSSTRGFGSNTLTSLANLSSAPPAAEAAEKNILPLPPSRHAPWMNSKGSLKANSHQSPAPSSQTSVSFLRTEDAMSQKSYTVEHKRNKSSTETSRRSSTSFGKANVADPDAYSPRSSLVSTR